MGTSTDVAIAENNGDQDAARLHPAEPTVRSYTPPRQSTIVTAIGGLLLTLIWAPLCNLVVEASMRADHLADLHTLLERWAPVTFVLGSTILWLLLVGLVALTARLWVSLSLVLVLSVVAGWANYVKIQQRQEPLYPSDLQFLGQISFLRDMVGLPVLAGAALSCLTCVVLAGLVGRFLSRRRYPSLLRQTQSRRRLFVLLCRLLAVALVVSAGISASRFNQAHNPIRTVYEGAGARWAWWYQLTNYERNGAIGGFLYNTRVEAMSSPPGYDRPSIDGVARRYAALADVTNTGRSANALDDVNVVLVLSEAFSDPLSVRGVQVAEDPIPYTRDLMNDTTSGSMLTQLIGGGTANMEFEVLTGMSLALFQPQMNAPFQMLLPDYDSWPSSMSLLEGGRRSLAIHPYLSKMYQRDVVYPMLGFDRFVTADDMSSPERIENSEFISDDAAFDEVARRIDTNEKPVLVNLVTMQNHYPTDQSFDHPIDVQGLDGTSRALAEGYMRGLRFSDEALERFLASLSNSDERTAVVFYGDHLPGFWPTDVTDSNGLTMRQTPFFLWSNFKNFSPQQSPIVSPIHFLPMLYEQTGAEISPYFALLDRLRDELPAMEQGLLFDPEGRLVSEDELTPSARQVLHDYRLVQYDLSIGHRWSADVMFGTVGRADD